LVLYEHVNLAVEISSELADFEGASLSSISVNNNPTKPTNDSKLLAAQEMVSTSTVKVNSTKLYDFLFRLYFSYVNRRICIYVSGSSSILNYLIMKLPSTLLLTATLTLGQLESIPECAVSYSYKPILHNYMN
jgi:hypothetical protein